MSEIEKLTLTKGTRTAAAYDELGALRETVIEHLNEQKALVEAELRGEAYQPTRQAYVTDAQTGQRVLKTVPKRPRRWYWHDLEGNWFIELRHGNRPLSIDGRNTAVKAGSKDKLPEVIDVLINAVAKGELDNIMKAAKKARKTKS